MQSKVLCLLALASAAAGQAYHEGLVPTLYWHQNEIETETETTEVAQFTPGCEGSVNTAYKASINNCNHWGTFSFRIRSTHFRDCSEGDDDEVAVWHFDYYSGATDCTGTSNTTMMRAGTCYVFEKFSVTFTTAEGEGMEKSCELASITSSLFGANYIEAKYTTPNPNKNCAGTPTDRAQNVIAAYVSTPYQWTAQMSCPNLCDGFCCKEVDAECNSIRRFKRITTCKNGWLVFGEVSYPAAESGCLNVNAVTTKVEVLGQCYTMDGIPTSAFSTISPPWVVGETCSWNKGDFIVSLGKDGLWGYSSNDQMIDEIPAANAVLSTIPASGSSLAVSLTTIAVAVLALFL